MFARPDGLHSPPDPPTVPRMSPIILASAQTPGCSPPPLLLLLLFHFDRCTNINMFLFSQSGSVVCSRVSCPSVACLNPVTPPGECCPLCTGVCRHLGKEHQSGSTFASPSDPCSSCSCLVGPTLKTNKIKMGFQVVYPASSFLYPPSGQNEVVNCQRRPCPVQCSNPVPSGTCCPVCDSCLYEGIVRAHGHAFTPSSNPCERCTCARGTVTCVPLVCPQTPCLRPVTKPGQCCPECTGTCALLSNLLTFKP